MLLGALRQKKLHRSPDAPGQSDIDEVDSEMGLEVEQDQIRQKAGLLRSWLIRVFWHFEKRQVNQRDMLQPMWIERISNPRHSVKI